MLHMNIHGLSGPFRLSAPHSISLRCRCGRLRFAYASVLHVSQSLRGCTLVQVPSRISDTSARPLCDALALVLLTSGSYDALYREEFTLSHMYGHSHRRTDGLALSIARVANKDGGTGHFEYAHGLNTTLYRNKEHVY
jgi:hypothetical protein